MSGVTILGLAGSAIILIALFEMMRRHRLREKYALIWALVALGIVTVAAFPILLIKTSAAIGLEVPANLLFFGASMVIFLAALRQIPESYYEAASIDGANAWQRFRRITLPLLTPVIFFNAILLIIGSFQGFTQAFVVSQGRGGPIDSTLLYSLYLYQRAFQQLDMGYASAMAWILLIVIAAITAFFFWTSRFWVFYGDDR